MGSFLSHINFCLIIKNKNILTIYQKCVVKICSQDQKWAVRKIKWIIALDEPEWEAFSFFLFEIKRVLVYNPKIFKITDLFILYFLFKMYLPKKQYLRKKAKNYVWWVQYCDLKSQLSEILREPLNPREPGQLSGCRFETHFIVPGGSWTFLSDRVEMRKGNNGLQTNQ